MGLIRLLLAALALLAAAPAGAQAPGRAAVGADSTVEVGADGAEVALVLSRAVPWSVGLRDGPPRLVIDLSEGDFSALAPGALGPAAGWGRLAPGRTRLVVALPAPMGVARAWMETGADGATVRVELDADVAPVVGADAPAAPVTTRPAPRDDGPLVVALDPGHGGLDPGAERGGVREADMMLRFARELAEVLRRAGHEVVLTREDDSFLSLRGRAGMARAARADVMISLHADAVAGGGAAGATVYTLSADEGDALTAELVERQDRADLLMGLDLGGSGDAVAGVLVDLARRETAPRAEALAAALVASIEGAGLALHKRPRLGAAFTVLKAPDIPTVLLELGFMSDAGDLENLLSRDWRARMAHAVARAVDAWALSDAALARRLRR